MKVTAEGLSGLNYQHNHPLIAGMFENDHTFPSRAVSFTHEHILFTQYNGTKDSSMFQKSVNPIRHTHTY